LRPKQAIESEGFKVFLVVEICDKNRKRTEGLVKFSLST
jgi:hypothetical protein